MWQALPFLTDNAGSFSAGPTVRLLQSGWLHRYPARSASFRAVSLLNSSRALALAIDSHPGNHEVGRFPAQDRRIVAALVVSRLAGTDQTCSFSPFTSISAAFASTRPSI